MSNLTIRQSRFADEYIVTGNAAAAARAAGYSTYGAKVTGCRLLTKPNLQAAISAKQLESANEFQLRREHIVGAITQAIAMAREQRAPAVMIRGLVEIARLCGFYDPTSLAAEKRLQTAGENNDVRNVPTAELLRMISHGGEFRNPDGSMMDASEVDAFYKGLSTAEITALAEGRARIEMRLVLTDL